MNKFIEITDRIFMFISSGEGIALVLMVLFTALFLGMNANGTLQRIICLVTF